MTPDELLRARAADQFGLVTRAQAAALGLDAHAMRHRIERGEWFPISRRVLRAAAAPDHPMLTASAALLDVGGDVTVSRHSAAALWGLPGFRLDPVHVVRGRETHVAPSRLAVVHTSRDLHDGHVSLVDGLRVTTPLRTIFDLAGSLHPGRTERLLDNASGRGLCTYGGLHHMLQTYGGRGRAGVTLLRELAEERPVGSRPPESGLEARVNHLLVQDGQRPLVRQVDLGTDQWVGRFDLSDGDDNFVLEIQSALYHASLLDRRRDAERRALLEAAGWVVAEAHDHDIWHQPQIVLEIVRNGRKEGRLKRWRANETTATSAPASAPSAASPAPPASPASPAELVTIGGPLGP